MGFWKSLEPQSHVDGQSGGREPTRGGMCSLVMEGKQNDAHGPEWLWNLKEKAGVQTEIVVV